MVLLENYNRAKADLLIAFGFPEEGDKDAYSVFDYTDVYWGWSEDYLNYALNQDDDEGEFFGLSVNTKLVKFYGDYTMLLVDDDNGGEDFLAIFDNNKRDLHE